MPRLILASTSRYRRELLTRLGIEFTTAAPETPETVVDTEPPRERAARLAAEKALAVDARVRGGESIVIGADQVAALAGGVLHKPGTREKAVEQLVRCQGQAVDFFTAVTVIAPTGRETWVDHTRVHFRTLGIDALQRYVALDNPIDCAGGFKAEGLGIALFERIESTDPTALIGLPMIWLAGTLARFGLDPLE